MKIVFINLKDIEGGAGIAAYRLSQGLERYFHTENYFIVGKKLSSDARVFPTIDSPSETVREVKLFIEFMTNKLLNRLGLQYVYFPFSTRFILKKVNELKPDVISLHVTHGGYFKTSLIRDLSRLAPVVWTLHDMWPFTANAAHTFGDESWKQLKSGSHETAIYPHIGWNTGKWLLKRKKNIYKNANIRMIAPSQWMADQARQSPVFENKPIHRITHGLDLDFFKPLDKTSCKKALHLDANARVLMFSSADDLEHSPWKGGQLLIDILTAIDSKIQGKHRLEVLVLGKGRLSGLQHLKNLTLHPIGHFHSETLIRTLFCASDLFIYPTRADSLGLVLVESIACGTPCITFAIGGCTDVIQNGISGYLIEPFDTNLFADKAVELLNDPETRDALSRSARSYAETHFGLKTMAEKYHEIFKIFAAL
ncbi:MAG: glycosyltransferase [Candidatus Omnitrophota bacterium]